MGEVYRASHHTLARPAAVKLIRQEVLGSTSAAGARLIVERFRREAQATASLQSPHTISLYDFGVSEDGTFFLVMELLDGLDLERLVQRSAPCLPSGRSISLSRPAHRSRKPMPAGWFTAISSRGTSSPAGSGSSWTSSRCSTFGLVKAEKLGSGPVAADGAQCDGGDPRLHRAGNGTGNSGGSPGRTSMRLGCVAYWLVTGKLVFEAPTAVAMMLKHANETPFAPSRRTEMELPSGVRRGGALPVSRSVRRTVRSPPQSWPAAPAAVREQPGMRNGQQRWWERHRPLNACSEECVECDMRLMPALTSEPEAAEQASGAADRDLSRWRGSVPCWRCCAGPAAPSPA